MFLRMSEYGSMRIEIHSPWCSGSWGRMSGWMRILYYCITVLLYHCITVSLYPCITLSMYNVLLYPCITVSRYHCELVPFVWTWTSL